VPLTKLERADIQKLGANIRRERNALGLTQEKLAEMADLHLRSLQKIEAGEINLLVTTVLRIKRALKCSWEQILD
jgi:predicted transcriptional regulator